ncbi:hypothetical protein GH714_035027 [Hevea brasiliensis]|uniref:DUF7135 domain-containing protein n=1 Tax=Hevea brasiliensis TaxID=3981 RepID=A0A6A6N767_HEVBR|nr:hypothetical protein GH714_035027 [Hevea brasiliensis]
MGTSLSREGEDLSDSESEYLSEEEEEVHYDGIERQETPQSTSSTSSRKALEEIDTKLKFLKLKYPNSQHALTNRPVKLYLHIGGNTPAAKWVVSDKLASYNFVKTCKIEVGSKVRARVSTEMQLKMFGDQRRVDFVNNGVWALKFFTDEEYRKFLTQFQDCLFENVYGLEATEENKIKVYGKEFIGWVKPEIADDTMWEDAEGDTASGKSTPVRVNQDLIEEFEEAANGDVQSLTLGALNNSFLVNDLGVQVYRIIVRVFMGRAFV